LGCEMIASRKFKLLLLYMLFLIAAGSLPEVAQAAEKEYEINEWLVQWIDENAEEDGRPQAGGEWVKAGADNPATSLPKGKRGMWVRLVIPPTVVWQQPGLLVERLFGHRLAVYHNDERIYDSERNFLFDSNKLLLSLKPYRSDSVITIRIDSLSERAGLISGVRAGEFYDLSNDYAKKDLPDLLLGTSIAFVAIIMLVCSGYLNRKQRGTWISLCLIALTTGTLIIAYCPLTYIYFHEYGNFVLLLFDLSLFILFPALGYYINQVLEAQLSFFNKFLRFQIGYSIFCLLVFIFYKATGEKYSEAYILFTNMIFGVIILLQLLLIIVLSIKHAVKGNKDAVILSLGIFVLAISGVTDLTIYFLNEKRYELVLWKFGVICMIVSLVVIFARRISADHAMLITYSKELELYNHKMERTEKLKIISDLAASVAHEVRNPLQVTRGFLQLLSSRANNENGAYIGLAINELDRASAIITDFLTFAKPEMEEIKLLDLEDEMKKIEVMMTPLTTMQGGTLEIDIREKLFIYGNSSKFKQAFINMIKNSIEAIGEDGVIQIQGFAEKDKVVIRLTDNGSGMEEEEIAKLGVPYFSTKSKGTGLGLTVTFRIIEVMQGTIEFRSEKGKGTEVLVRFPRAIDQV